MQSHLTESQLKLSVCLAYFGNLDYLPLKKRVDLDFLIFFLVERCIVGQKRIKYKSCVVSRCIYCKNVNNVARTVFEISTEKQTNA